MNHIRRAAAVWLLAAVTTIGAAHAQTPEPLDIRTGVYRGRSVTYQVINGLAVVEGDIILGTPEELEPPKGPQVIKEPDARKEAVATSAPERLWPDGVVPYVIDSNLPEPRRVLNAIQHWNNNTLIQFVERTNEPNWITFEKPGEPICASSVGMAGGEQSLSLGDGCSVGAVIHEIGHAVGFWHEQQREDRDNHVNVLFDNIDKRRTLANFTQFIMTSDDIGPYNYGSIMHYSAYAFTRNNLPSIETIPPGMVIGEADGLSAGDIDGVNRLYGQTPTKTTISTNPPELQIRVDGMVFTAPQSFDWSPGTSHTISVPSPQGDNSERFLFGKWSDGGNQTHNVIAASSTTVFTAHFIQQFKIVTGAFPPESGTVTITPFPPGGFYTARTPVEVTAYPAEGFSFGIWLQPNVRLHGFSGNPARFPVRFPRLLNYTATFTQARPTTIAANFPGLRVVVDGLTWSLPLNFYWSVGTTHTIGVEDAVQVGPSGVSRWVFKEWSDGGAVTHNITVSEDVSTFTADFTKQYLLSTLALPPDGGSIEVAPSSRDGFYDDRTPVQVTAVPAPGFELSFWFGDVSGTDNPQSLTMDDQGWVNARFEESRQLISGVPTEFSLRAVSNPTLFNSSSSRYRVEVPEGATSLSVRLTTTTAAADVDLHVQRGSVPIVSEGRVVADHSSAGRGGGDELVVVTPESRPPLQAGTYFVALALFTTGVEASGTLTAEVEAPEVSPPRIDVSVPAFTFTSEEGMNPPPQTFDIRNSGDGTLNYQITTDQPWLFTFPGQGSSTGEADTIKVSVNSERLAESTFHGTITISESQAQATKQAARIQETISAIIPVTLVVTPASSGLIPGGLVNAASFNAFAAPASIMSLFGTGFADRTEVANTTPLPTTLAGTTVTVTDIRGVSRTAELFFVSEGQINFLIPEGTALGPTNVTATREDGNSGTIRILVEAVGPALFSANADGMGVAAASFLRVAADGSHTQGLIFNPNTRSSVPIDLGPEGDQVFLLLFGTGVRGFTQAVTATMQYLNADRFLKVENESVPVLGAVPQGQFVGLDQINIGPLPRSLVGRGTINILLTADGKRANVVTFNVR